MQIRALSHVWIDGDFQYGDQETLLIVTTRPNQIGELLSVLTILNKKHRKRLKSPHLTKLMKMQMMFQVTLKMMVLAKRMTKRRKRLRKKKQWRSSTQYPGFACGVMKGAPSNLTSSKSPWCHKIYQKSSDIVKQKFAYCTPFDSVSIFVTSEVQRYFRLLE